MQDILLKELVLYMYCLGTGHELSAMGVVMVICQDSMNKLSKMITISNERSIIKINDMVTRLCRICKTETFGHCLDAIYNNYYCSIFHLTKDLVSFH